MIFYLGPYFKVPFGDYVLFFLGFLSKSKFYFGMLGGDSWIILFLSCLNSGMVFAEILEVMCLTLDFSIKFL